MNKFTVKVYSKLCGRVTILNNLSAIQLDKIIAAIQGIKSSVRLYEILDQESPYYRRVNLGERYDN